MARSISAKAISGFVRAVRYLAGTPARFTRARLLVQLSGRNSRNASMTGTSPRASVSDTSVWQLDCVRDARTHALMHPYGLPRALVPQYGRGSASHTQASLANHSCSVRQIG